MVAEQPEQFSMLLVREMLKGSPKFSAELGLIAVVCCKLGGHQNGSCQCEDLNS